MHTGFSDRRCKHGRQVTAVATANDVPPGARRAACLKRQSNDDDQAAPIALFCGSASYNSSPNDVKTLTTRGTAYHDQLFPFERSTPAVSLSQISCRSTLITCC